MRHVLIIIYAIYLYNNLYPDKLNIINLILIALFPGFFIAATATINLNYLNPLYDKKINEYDYSSFGGLKNTEASGFTGDVNVVLPACTDGDSGTIVCEWIKVYES